MKNNPLSPDSLKIDCADQTKLISQEIRRLLTIFKRRGLVVALSGGIDSSVTAAVCVRAVGKERVFGLHMPDRDSSPDTLSLSRSVSSQYGFDSVIEDITPILEAAGCYSRQQKAVRTVIPEFGPGWKFKIAVENILQKKGFSFFNLIAQSPDGSVMQKQLPLEAYLGIVAATNFKQRVRKMMEYYHADRLNYAVAGTPNRLEYDQGFFVKLGDGAADLKPIAHLYKTQVYQLAEYLEVPEAIRQRPPTTDTYSLPQGQDEFFFSLPYQKLDLCLYAKNHGMHPEAVAPVVELAQNQVELIYRDIEMKRASTRYLHLKPQLVMPVGELDK